MKTVKTTINSESEYAIWRESNRIFSANPDGTYKTERGARRAAANTIKNGGFSEGESMVILSPSVSGFHAQGWNLFLATSRQAPLSEVTRRAYA